MTARPCKWRDPNRSVCRQRLVKQLIACGERPVMEAFIQAAAASPAQLDAILESYVSIAPEDYQAVGADVLPIDDLVLIDGDDE